jgi:hypothetical protein
VLGPTIVHVGADGCLVFASYNMDLTREGSTFLFFIFLVCCMLGGGQGTLPVLVKNVMHDPFLLGTCAPCGLPLAAGPREGLSPELAGSGWGRPTSSPDSSLSARATGDRPRAIAGGRLGGAQVWPMWPTARGPGGGGPAGVRGGIFCFPGVVW